MRHGHGESPLNPLPATLWALVLPILATEAAAALSSAGLFGGPALRSLMVERTAWVPELAGHLLATRRLPLEHAQRIVTYPFVHLSFLHAAFVVVFALALGKQLADVMRPWRLAVLFFATAILAALAYSGIGAALGMRLSPLIGGYPAVYGFIGGFTFLLWARLGQTGGNRYRAFTLIGILLAFQLVFGLLFGGAGTSWIAEIAGFVIGFAVTPLLVPGGFAAARRALQRR